MTLVPGAAVPAVQESLNSTGILARAEALAGGKKWQSAAALFRDVLKADPSDMKAAFGLGTALLQLKSYKDAVDVLAPLQKQLPDDPALKNNLAWIYATSTDPAVRNAPEAVKLAQQAAMAVPGDPDVWNTLSEAHYAAGEYDIALRTARIALQIVMEIAPARADGFVETLRRCSRAAEAWQRSGTVSNRARQDKSF